MTEEAESLLAELMDFGGPHPNPYPIYHRLREIDPMFRSERLNARVVTGYREVLEVHTNRALGQGRNAISARSDPRFERSTYLSFLPRMTPWIDPPEHTRLRAIFGPAFTPRRMNAVAGYVQGLVDRFLAEAEQDAEPDLVARLAVRLPVSTICHLLGLPEELHVRGLRWAQSMAEAILSVGAVSDELLATVDDSVAEGLEYLSDELAARRREPRDDLLSALAAAESDGQRLTDAEAVALAYQLFIAAAETTVGSIGLGLVALLRQPDQLRLLRETPALDGAAVEEILRYDAPTQMNLRRFAHEATEIGGVPIEEGEALLPVNAAANRDPREVADPDRFDITRRSAPLMTFGRGIHSCVGAPLARLQIRIAIGTVIRRFPDLAFAREPVLRGSPGLRAVAELPVVLGARDGGAGCV